MKTAQENLDYIPIRNHTVFLAKGSRTQIHVNIDDDTEAEPDEQFLIVMTGSNVGWGSTNVTVTILANDREFYIERLYGMLVI